MKAKQHTLIVLLVFVLSAGAALTLLTHANQKAEQAASEAEDGSIPLLDVTTATLESVSIQYGGETLTLRPSDDGWTLTEDPAYHLDDSACSTIRTALAGMKAKRQLEVNFWGMVRTTKAVLPVMRAQRSGRIVNTSSVAAVTPIPFQTYYSVSKAAINSFTMSVGNEVRPYGIRISAVMPGDTRTGFTDARARSFAGDNAYGGRISRSVAKMEKDERGGALKEPEGVLHRWVCLSARHFSHAAAALDGGQRHSRQNVRRIKPPRKEFSHERTGSQTPLCAARACARNVRADADDPRRHHLRHRRLL